MYYNDYPIVLCHGMMGWGEGEGMEEKSHYWGAMSNKFNLVDHLRDEGRTVIYPSLGPLSGAWDRACELWAVLMGGTVDYGKVHSKKCGHKRFGRTYPGLLKDWGQKGPHAKIDILGHSFGGPTVITFCSILEAGSEEERKGTPKSELSEFFKGGKGDWVHTCTTLSGVNNGTLLGSNLYKGIPLVSYLNLKMFADGKMGDKDFWDPFIDRWGLENGTKSLKAKYTLLKFSFKTKFDNMGYEMTIEHRKEFNKDLAICPHTYYFARVACPSKNIFGKQLVPPKFGLASVVSLLTGGFIAQRLKDEYGIDESWLPNDGFVSVPGQRAPMSLPSYEWDGKKDSLKAGQWANCKPDKWDHTGYEGKYIGKDTYYAYFDEMIDLFRSLPDA